MKNKISKILSSSTVVLALVLGLLSFAPSANAGIGLGIAPNFPSPLTAGQTGVSVGLDITNNSNGVTTNIILDNIFLTPSCGDFNVPCTTPDPGVFAASATGAGANACLGRTFTIAVIDVPTGKLQFTPDSTINLALGAVCQIDFTVDVLKVPTQDLAPGGSVQTAQVGQVTAHDPNNGDLPGSGTGTNAITINKASPQISTTPSAGGIIGVTLNDTATLTGGLTPTGTVTFKLFPPSEPLCAANEAYSFADTTAPYDTATDGGFVSNAAGVWHWTADYAGDANNNPASSPCEAETVTVTNKLDSNTVTEIHNVLDHGTAVTSVPAGSTVDDKATVTGSGPTPTGTVDFTFWTGGNNCDSGQSSVSGSVALDGSGVAHPSTSQGPLAVGSYAFRAHYLGDGTYNESTGLCEPLTVTTIGSQTTTEIHDPNHTDITNTTVPVGTIVHDQATVTDGGTATGTVTFKRYSNDSCSSDEDATETVPLDAFGKAETSNFTTVAGSLSYLAHYNGDATHDPSDAQCEVLTVGKLDSHTVTVIHDSGHNTVTSVPPGTTVHDKATVSGTGPTPSGLVTFNVYNNTTCNGTVLSTENLPLSGGIVESSDTVANSSMSYQAVYGGDGNYGPSTGDCEPLTVTRIPTCDLKQCDGEVDVSTKVLVDLNPAVPTCTGDAVLCAPGTFTFSKVGTPDQWKAIFNLGARKLVVQSGGTITVAQVGQGNNKYSPGIEINTTCDVLVENGGHIIVESLNKNAGDITVNAGGNITVNGEVRNEVKGTNGLPGKINLNSVCGYDQSTTGIVEVLGVDPGGNEINIFNTGAGDMNINGLVLSRAHAHVPPLDQHRPNINVKDTAGDININGNSVEPLYDEYNYGGGKYDLWGGLLSWVTNNVPPGTVKVQASGSVTVSGHGDDPTGPVRKSFGAVAAVGTASSAPGGVVNVVALGGNIIGNDRAFDVSGRNRLATNYAHIYLDAMSNVTVNKAGANASFNPQADASSPTVGDKGGRNDIRAWNGAILQSLNSLISAHVPPGSGSTPGVNTLTYCTAITYPDATHVDPYSGVTALCGGGPAPIIP